MRNDVARTPGRTNDLRSRRVMAAGLGIAAVVGTAGIARASGGGDGFLTSPSTSASGSSKGMASSTGMPYSTGMAQVSSTAPSPGTAMAVAPSSMMPQPAADPGCLRETAGMSPFMVGSRAPMAGRMLRFRTVGDPMVPAFNQALGINNQGMVVGYSGSGADAQHPNRGFEISPPYRQRDVHARNVPGSAQTQVIGINRRGDTAGFWVDPQGVTSGFVRMGGAYTSVANPAGTAKPAENQLLSINDRRIAAGFYNDAAGMSHPYLYDVCRRTFTPVVLPFPVDSAQATGVNDAGTVTGLYVEGKVTHAFVSTGHRVTSLTLGDGSNTQALGVDSAGDVVGSYVDARGRTHGFLWAAGSLRTIDAPNSAGSTVVNGLDDLGRLVGFYTTRDHRTVGFVAR